MKDFFKALKNNAFHEAAICFGKQFIGEKSWDYSLHSITDPRLVLCSRQRFSLSVSISQTLKKQRLKVINELFAEQWQMCRLNS